MSRFQSNWEKEDISEKINEDFNLSNINIGPPIAKGCAAVVYAASIKKDCQLAEEQVKPTDFKTAKLQSTPRNEMLSPIQYTSRFIHNLGGSVDNLSFNRPNVDSEFVPKTNEPNQEKDTEMPSNAEGVRSVHFNTAANVMHSKRKESTSSDEEQYVEVCPSMHYRYPLPFTINNSLAYTNFN